MCLGNLRGQFRVLLEVHHLWYRGTRFCGFDHENGVTEITGMYLGNVYVEQNGSNASKCRGYRGSNCSMDGEKWVKKWKETVGYLLWNIIYSSSYISNEMERLMVRYTWIFIYLKKNESNFCVNKNSFLSMYTNVINNCLIMYLYLC